jgi:hypothetical protein
MSQTPKTNDQSGSRKGKKKKTSPSLKELSRMPLGNDDLKLVLSEIKSSSDRVTAITFSAWIDRVIEQAILDHLPMKDDEVKRRLVDNGGALSTSFAKNHLGYAMGLYGKSSLNNLETIRRIRNAFAHAAVPLTFDTEQVATEIGELEIEADREIPPSMSPNKGRFISTCAHFVAILHLKELGFKLNAWKTIYTALGDRATQPDPSTRSAIENAIEEIHKLIL